MRFLFSTAANNVFKASRLQDGQISTSGLPSNYLQISYKVEGRVQGKFFI